MKSLWNDSLSWLSRKMEPSFVSETLANRLVIATWRFTTIRRCATRRSRLWFGEEDLEPDIACWKSTSSSVGLEIAAQQVSRQSLLEEKNRLRSAKCKRKSSPQECRQTRWIWDGFEEEIFIGDQKNKISFRIMISYCFTISVTKRISKTETRISKTVIRRASKLPEISNQSWRKWR